jgi:hypothetical protein
MAQVNQRLWKIPGQRTKRKAWGLHGPDQREAGPPVQGRVDPGRRRGGAGQGAPGHRAGEAEGPRHHAGAGG